RIERRMRRGARRIELDGDAAMKDFPANSEIANRRIDSIALAVHGDQIPLWSIDRVWTRREPTLRQPCRHDTIARGHARMERFDHAADVFFQAARRCRRDAQRVLLRLSAETEHARGSRGRTHGPD